MINTLLETLKEQVNNLKKIGKIEESKLIQQQIDKISELNISNINNAEVTYDMFVNMFLGIKPFFDKMNKADKDKFFIYLKN